MTGTIRRHEHAAVVRDILQEHVRTLQRLDYAILRALEYARHPDNLPSVNATLRDARRALLDDLDETDAAAWDACVHAAFTPDARPIFPTQADGTHSEQNARTGGPPPEEAQTRG